MKDSHDCLSEVLACLVTQGIFRSADEAIRLLAIRVVANSTNDHPYLVPPLGEHL